MQMPFSGAELRLNMSIIRFPVLQGLNTSSENDWQDTLPVNMLSVFAPVLNDQSYMHTWAGLLNVNMTLDNSAKGAIYNTNTDTAFRINGQYIYEISQNVINNQLNSWTVTNNENDTYFPMAYSQFTVAFIDGSKKLRFINKTELTPSLDLNTLTELKGWSEGEFDQVKNSILWIVNFGRIDPTMVTTNYVIIPDWNPTKAQITITFFIKKNSGSSINRNPKLDRWIISNFISLAPTRDGIYISETLEEGAIENTLFQIWLKVGQTETLLQTFTTRSNELQTITTTIPIDNAFPSALKFIGEGFFMEEGISVMSMTLLDDNSMFENRNYYFYLYSESETEPPDPVLDSISSMTAQIHEVNSAASWIKSTGNHIIQRPDFYVNYLPNFFTEIGTGTDHHLGYILISIESSQDSADHFFNLNWNPVGRAQVITFSLYLDTVDPMSVQNKWVFTNITRDNLLTSTQTTFNDDLIAGGVGILIRGNSLYLRMINMPDGTVVETVIADIILTAKSWQDISIPLAKDFNFNINGSIIQNGTLPSTIGIGLEKEDGINKFSVAYEGDPLEQSNPVRLSFDFNKIQVNLPIATFISPSTYIASTNFETTDFVAHIINDERPPFWKSIIQQDDPTNPVNPNNMAPTDQNINNNIIDVVHNGDRYIFIRENEKGFYVTEVTQLQLGEQRPAYHLIPTTNNGQIPLISKTLPVIACRRWRDLVVIFTRHSIEYFRLTGTEQIYGPVQAYRTEIGSLSNSTVINFDDGFALVGGPVDQPPSVYVTTQSKYREIATRRIKQYLRNYTIDELKAIYIETFEYDRHRGFIIHLSNLTLVYDFKGKGDGSWCILASGETLDDNYIGIHHIYNENQGINSQWQCGDKSNGNLYIFDYDSAQHNGKPVLCRLYTSMMQLRNVSLHDFDIDKISNETTTKSLSLSATLDGQNYLPSTDIIYNNPSDFTERVLLRNVGYVQNNIGFRLDFIVDKPISISNVRMRVSK